MARIIVTGGAGFIGSHLCDHLLNQENDVLCIDNFFTGNKRNIIHLLDNHQFELIRHDITEPILLEVDQIYHFACPASPVHYQYNPVKTIKTNVMGTINMLGLAKRVKARIMQASTSEVYGDPKIHPQTESYWGNVNPIGLRSCYDEGKRVAETLMMDYHRQNKVDIKIIRIDGRVVSNFIMQALKNKNISVYGEGNQSRAFCYIDDMVDGILKMMVADNFIGPVNIGNPGEFTILELAQKVIDLTGSKSKIDHHPLPPDDPVQRKPDISLIKEKLGWKPTIELQEGLTKTIEYFEKLIAGANI